MSIQVWPLLNVPASSNWHLASIRAQPVKAGINLSCLKVATCMPALKGQMYSIHM